MLSKSNLRHFIVIFVAPRVNPNTNKARPDVPFSICDIASILN